MSSDDDNNKAAQVFFNRITKGGPCGNFGNEDILQNSDSLHSYTVTIEEVSSGSHSGGTNTTQREVRNSAGGKCSLGCDKLAGFGSPSVSRRVVGEERH